MSDRRLNLWHFLLLLLTPSDILLLSTPSYLDSKHSRLLLTAQIPSFSQFDASVLNDGAHNRWPCALVWEAPIRSRAIVPADLSQIAEPWKADVFELTLVCLAKIVAANHQFLIRVSICWNERLKPHCHALNMKMHTEGKGENEMFDRVAKEQVDEDEALTRIRYI